jgi:hypothetical protein
MLWLIFIFLQSIIYGIEMKTRAILLMICSGFFYIYSYGQQLNPIGTFQFNNSSASRSTIYKIAKEKAFCFKADLDLDASGSPRAYSPSNLGILDNESGKDPLTKKKWVAVVLKRGQPVYQDGSCAYPGFYISTTSLKINGYKRVDYRHYVDSDSIPYIALPRKAYKKMKVKLGDIAWVYNTQNKKYCYAVFANVLPHNNIGQGSIRLAKELGLDVSLNKYGRVQGGESSNRILYVLLPNSGCSSYKKLNINILNKLGECAAKKMGDLSIYAEKLLYAMKD